LGICFGMQIAVIEMARNLLKIKDAYSTEFGPIRVSDDRGPLVGLMTEWSQGSTVQKRTKDSDLGGTMRLGAYDCEIKTGTLAHKIYKKKRISERHRHRYEVNNAYIEDFKKHGAIFSGLSPSGHLPEIVELKDHPFFIGVQFHPEFKSRPYKAHPLFVSYVKAAKDAAKKRK
ncbi:MAG: CTP synthetase, partial [Rickettsiales bacterium]|nr:CTP synthetase [Rickettsiales bacterium]